MMRFVITMIVMGSTQAFSYAFLCNGVDANGNPDSDPCFESCSSHPTKWANKEAIYHLDTSELIDGLSLEEWVDEIVDEAFDNWVGVPDTDLKITVGTDSEREFGTDDDKNNIFWVTESSDWPDELLGPADTGTLAVTAPMYECPKQGQKFRSIIDADMIINGVPSARYNWKPTCSILSRNCQSILATVAHEAGHFLGLGHPDQQSPTLMSAIASYLVEHPQLDDMQGIRALYPGASPGAYTTVCSDTQPCAPGLTCHTQGSAKYCSKSCSSDSDCRNHLRCNSNSKFCEFPNSQQLGAVGFHQECSSNPCSLGLLCVGVSSGKEHCFTSCTSNSSACSGKETCRQLRNFGGDTLASKACIEIRAEGESCAGPVSCDRTQNLTCSSEGICVSQDSKKDSVDSGCSATGNLSQWTWLVLFIPWIIVSRRRKKC